MDTKTRAAKIWHDLQNLNLSVSEVDFIAAQIDEVMWESQRDLLMTALVQISEARNEGFAQALEQAAGIIKNGHKSAKCVDPEDCPYCCFAERIRAMTPGGK